jgi:hypothetical protein
MQKELDTSNLANAFVNELQPVMHPMESKSKGSGTVHFLAVFLLSI